MYETVTEIHCPIIFYPVAQINHVISTPGRGQHGNATRSTCRSDEILEPILISYPILVKPLVVCMRGSQALEANKQKNAGSLGPLTTN